MWLASDGTLPLLGPRKSRRKAVLTEALAVIIGAVVGAAGGIAGGGFAALASLRASQVSARAPLGPLLHKIGRSLIRMRSTRGTEEYPAAQLEFALRWNEFAIQQRILCPSDTISNLMELVLAISRDPKSDPDALLLLAGQVVDKVTKMVGAHCHHLFRYRARKEEKRIMRRWLEMPDANKLSPQLREKLINLT